MINLNLACVGRRRARTYVICLPGLWSYNCAVKFSLRIRLDCAGGGSKKLPKAEIYENIPYNVRNYQILCEYRSKVIAAGSWAAYERAHRTRLTKVLAPKFPQIPAEIVPTIVAFAFHTGWY